MKKSLVVALILTVAVAGVAGAQAPLRPFESDADPKPQGRIDELIFERLDQLGIPPARLCSDEVFLRRAYLDVIGTLPTAEQARQFLLSKDADKRAQLIDQLRYFPKAAHDDGPDALEMLFSLIHIHAGPRVRFL